MQLKQYRSYQMDFAGKWTNVFCISLGAAIFTLIVHYFAFTDLQSVFTAEWIFLVVLPLLLDSGLVVLFRLWKWNSPGLFSILGCAACLFLIIGNLMTGSVIQIVLSSVWYIGSALLFLAAAGGYLPGRFPAGCMFFAAFVFRLLLFSVPILQSSSWLYECSVLLRLVALGALVMCMKPIKK